MIRKLFFIIILSLLISVVYSQQKKDASEKQFFEIKKSIEELKKEMELLREKVYEIEIEASDSRLKEKVKNILNLPEITNTIILKNGSIIKGKLVKEDIDKVIIQTNMGYLTLYKRDIEQITSADYKEAKLIFSGPVEELVYKNRIEYNGKIKNIGLRRADFPRVIIEAYDEKANLIDADTTYLEGRPFIYKTGVQTDCTIYPEEELPFKCIIYIPEGRKYSHYIKKVEWEEFE